jgi:hypothetical protein
VNADTNELLSLLSQFLFPLPLFLVWLGASAYSPPAPTPDGVAAHPCAVVIQTLATFLGTFGSWYLIRARQELNLANADLGLRMAVLSFARVGLSVLAYVFLFVAVFGWRTSPAKRFPNLLEEGPLSADNPGDERIRR